MDGPRRPKPTGAERVLGTVSHSHRIMWRGGHGAIGYKESPGPGVWFRTGAGKDVSGVLLEVYQASGLRYPKKGGCG